MSRGRDKNIVIYTLVERLAWCITGGLWTSCRLENLLHRLKLFEYKDVHSPISRLKELEGVFEENSLEN